MSIYARSPAASEEGLPYVSRERPQQSDGDRRNNVPGIAIAWAETDARGAAIVAAAVVATAAQPAQRHPVSGRVIAQVMGFEGAAWLERPEREREEEPSKAVAALDIRPGQVVADVGAGSGYYTVRLAERVGRRGRSSPPTSSRKC